MNISSKPRLVVAVFALASAAVFSGCIGLPSSVKATRNLEYAQVDGHSLKLDIYSPRQPVGKLPVVIWIHGGAWNSGGKEFCPISFMAIRNMAIVSIDYRLSRTATFPAQLYDCKGAVRWLRANAVKYGLDAEHIGIAAVSAGGHLGLLLATTANHPELEGDVGGNLNYSSSVQCVVALYSPTDLNRLVSNPVSRAKNSNEVAELIGGSVEDNADKAITASPLIYVDKSSPPIYLMHGALDTLVPPEQSEIFYDALKQAGVSAHLEIVPNKGHGIVPPQKVAEDIYAFFDRYLKTCSGTRKSN